MYKYIYTHNIIYSRGSKKSATSYPDAFCCSTEARVDLPRKIVLKVERSRRLARSGNAMTHRFPFKDLKSPSLALFARADTVSAQVYMRVCVCVYAFSTQNKDYKKKNLILYSSSTHSSWEEACIIIYEMFVAFSPFFPHLLCNRYTHHRGAHVCTIIYRFLGARGALFAIIVVHTNTTTTMRCMHECVYTCASKNWGKKMKLKLYPPFFLLRVIFCFVWRRVMRDKKGGTGKNKKKSGTRSRRHGEKLNTHARAYKSLLFAHILYQFFSLLHFQEVTICAHVQQLV